MNKEIFEILQTVPVGAMATVNRDRTPLVTPLHFARLDDSIIWASEPSSRHAENAMRTGRAEFVVWNDEKQAVYLKTSVLCVAADQLPAAQAAYRAKHGDFVPCSEKREWYICPIGDIDDNSTTENWLHYIA